MYTRNIHQREIRELVFGHIDKDHIEERLHCRAYMKFNTKVELLKLLDTPCYEYEHEHKNLGIKKRNEAMYQFTV